MKDKPKEPNVAQFDPTLIESIEQSLDSEKRIFAPSLIKILREEALIQLSKDPYSQPLVAKLQARQPAQEDGANPIEEEDGDLEPPTSKGHDDG
jgi:hypothetical protein